MTIFRRNKNNNKPLIRQIIDLIPSHLLRSSAMLYNADKGAHTYKTYDHLVAMLFGQLNKLSTLDDISSSIGVSETFIKDLGLKQSPARSTMSDWHKKRNWQVFEHLFNGLLGYYKNPLMQHNNQQVIKEVEGKTILLRDSSTISLCLKLFNWAKFRTAKGGIKIHTQFDEAMMMPNFVSISEAAVHDSKGFKQNTFEKGTIIVEDKGYWDFEVIKARIQAENTFITRIKDNTVFTAVKELDLPDNKDEHILKDQLIHLTGKAALDIGLNEQILRMVVVYDSEKDLQLDIITNNLDWDATTIALLYKRRWDIEIFFKLLKQNLQVKTFLGTSENAVKSQIFIALIAYLLLELTRRTFTKGKAAFSNFVEKIRVCLAFYLTLEYVIRHVKSRATKLKKQELEIDFNQRTLFPT
jgi:hypothetical protein